VTVFENLERGAPKRGVKCVRYLDSKKGPDLEKRTGTGKKGRGYNHPVEIGDMRNYLGHSPGVRK